MLKVTIINIVLISKTINGKHFFMCIYLFASGAQHHLQVIAPFLLCGRSVLL
jgi:hypothetical protein